MAEKLGAKDTWLEEQKQIELARMTRLVNRVTAKLKLSKK